MQSQYWRRSFESNLHKMENPAVYLGTEPGTEVRDWEVAPLRICVVGASTYDNLTGNLAVPMLTRMLLEADPDWVVHRAFFPNSRKDLDFFTKNKIPVFGLESKRRLNDYDVLAFSASFQGLDLNVIRILDLCKIPPLREDRGDVHPWIFRGGQNDSNPTPFMSLYDMCYIGEAEVNFVKILKLLMKAKAQGIERIKVKKALTKLDGCLVPEFYIPKYDEEKPWIFKGWDITWEGAPYPVKAARIADINKTYLYRHPVLNYTEAMGSGEILISKGCQARCNFCNEGWKEKPYRELDPDIVVDAIRQNMIESGAKDVVLSAFCVSSYRRKKYVMKRLMEEVSPEVGLTSQRADESAEDPEFMKWTAQAGNRSVSFGVEGMSERLRVLVSKHATKEVIVKAVENAVAGGYNKIKLFCISNLPTESEADREEWLELAKAVREARDKFPGQKCQIRFQFTDITITPHTPFQWNRPTQGQRNLSPYIKRIKEATGLRVAFGAGKGHDLDSLLQIMYLSDPRLTPVLVKLATYHDIVYFRQVPKETFQVVKDEIAAAGMDWEWFWRARDYEEMLPWEIITYGMKKSYLWKVWERALNGVQTPKCNQKCEKCGALTCEGSLLPIEDDVSPPKQLQFIPVDQHLVLRINVNPEHRFVPASVRKQLVRRALYMQDIPIMRDVEVVSDTFRDEDWVSGVDYAAVRLTRKLNEAPLVKSLCKAFEVESVAVRNTNAAKLFGSRVCAHSKIRIMHPVAKVKDGVERLTKNQSETISVRVSTQMGTETVKLKVRETIFDLWISQDLDGFFLHSLHDGGVSINDIYHNVVKLRSWTEVAGLPAVRLEVYVVGQDLGTPKCISCGRKQMQTVSGNWVCPVCSAGRN